MASQRFLLITLLLLLILTGCSVSNDPARIHFRQLQMGIVTEDTSYAYSLPYKPNTTHQLVQGYFSQYSHRNRAALDFKMKRGTDVHAARGGVVVRMKEDGVKGGWNRKYRPEGNFIVIQHDDSSRAGYWHLQPQGVLVNAGDTVQQGQLIGICGKTGYALFPHLHFLVWRNSRDGRWQQIATRFKTSKGIIYLRPFRRYKNKQP